ncbi:hypothetical protein RF55_18537 [Lasius niger]|uniref:Double jelly roll-like domain-containing protein n=1 Tax=Lasius niger TaxID=67767 RepID=A0A0J7K174_LASNI|nr:hypothetical protein RF55_18537 [Lasius niger]
MTVLNLQDIEFPVTVNQIKKFELANNISINVYSIENGIVPIRLSEQKKDKHVNLLYMQDSNSNSVRHFAWIKNLSRLVSTQLSKHDHKTATQLEKPRYVIFALQAGRKNVMSENMSQFDDCKSTNVKLYLNSECYPYDDMNLNFDKNRWSILYDMYARFCKNYYGYVSRAESHRFYVTVRS